MDRRKLIRKLKGFKAQIKSRYNPSKVILFGSMANGKSHKDSDVDIIIVSKIFEGKKSFKRAPDLSLEWHLKTDIGLPVDFLCYTPEEFDRLRKQITVVREAVENGIEI